MKTRVLMIDCEGRGGMAHYTYNLVQALSACPGIECCLLTEKGYELDFLPRNFKVATAAIVSGPYLKALANIIRLVREFQPDIIHVQTLLTARRDWLFFILGRMMGAKVVFTCHNVLPHEDREKRAFFLIPSFRIIYHFSRLLIAHSRFSADKLVRLFKVDPGKIRVIPHGNYLFFRSRSMSRQEACQSLGLDPGRKIVLFFGAVREYKGLDILLEAFKEVKDREPSALLLVAGRISGLDIRQLRDAVERAGLGNDVLFHAQYIPFDRVDRYFFCSDIAVFPYKEIDMSGALHLAYAFGKPVVCFNSGGLPEVVRHGRNGLLVPPFDSPALAQGIIKLLADEGLRRQMGEESLRLAKEDFSWTGIAASTAEAYRELTGRHEHKTILYVSDTGAVIGGGQISLLNLLENLDRKKFRPVVAVPAEGDWSSRVKALDIPVRLFPYKKVLNPFNLGSTIAAVKALLAVIRAEQVDLVHANATGGIVFLAGLACLLSGKPLVSHVRLLQTGLLQDIIQGMLSARIVAISKKVAAKKGFALFRDKLALIYNGVDLERFDCRRAGEEVRRELGIPENSLLIGAAGVYLPAKGFDYLIKAAGLLRGRFPDLRVVIVGFQTPENKAYVDMLRRVAEDNRVKDTVTLMDRSDDPAAFFRALDIVVFPSLMESFGRVLIEAMACAKPVVAFNSGAVPEIVVDGVTGFLVPALDHRAMAARIEELLKDTEKRRLFGENGRRRCQELFDIRAHSRAVQDLYLQVLKDPSLGFLPCPVCRKLRYRRINSCKVDKEDALISEQYLSLCRCRGCGLVAVNPQPRVLEEDPAHLYDKEYFSNYLKFHGTGENGAAVELNEPYSLRLDLIKRFKNSGLLLDIGCASGEFMKASREAGFMVKGVDISPYACQQARNTYGLDVQEGTFEAIEFPRRSFDVVSCADVLEHTREPVVFLQRINDVLKDDGVLYLAVPDFASIHYRLMSLLCRFTRKNYFVLPHHLYHFTPATMRKVLEKSGFTVRVMVGRESAIRETGLRRLAMKAIFFAGRALGRRDRMVVIASKQPAMN